MKFEGASMLEAIKVPVNPFPGLRPFKFNESNLFFGRDGQIGKLVSKLATTRFLAVVGTSGSGKSSLIQAGLLPALRTGAMKQAGSNWRFAVMRPANDPIGALAAALNEPEVFGSDDSENAAIQEQICKATLRRGCRGLVEVAEQNALPADENLLVVVDQFEELFRFAREATRKTKQELDAYQNDATAFVKLLLEANSEANIYVLLTMRSDFLGDCSQFQNLPEAINESQYLIPRLTREQLREVICGPVLLAGGDITSRLITQLLNDIADDQDQLPVLQHLLMRMWNESKEPKHQHEGKAIDLCCYEAVGGMKHALSRHADEAFKELSESSQIVAEKLFKALTEKGPDNREVRRPITVAEICEVVSADSNEVIQIINTFRQPGRSFLMPSADVKLKPISLIDISHESLIRSWDSLREWTDEEARSSRIYIRLAETAELQSREEEAPLRSPALELMLDWRETNSPTEAWAKRYHPEFRRAMEFLDFSLAKDKETKEVDKIRLEKERDNAREFAAQQEKLAKVERVSAARQKKFLAVFAVLALLTLAGLGYGFNSRGIKLDEQLRLKNEALAAEAIAKEEKARASDAQRMAEKERDNAAALRVTAVEARVKADEAREAAITARKAADDLATVRKEEAKISGYYKTAFDELAAGNNAEAIENLTLALEYFEAKHDNRNIISTLINIGDVDSFAGEEDGTLFDYEGAIDSYEKAIQLIKKTNAGDELLIKTLEKAAKAGEGSDAQDELLQSAGYYRQISQIYHRLNKPDEEADSLFSAGSLFSNSDDDDSEAEAKEEFERAIAVFANSPANMAAMNLKIAKHYVELLQAVEEEEDNSPAPAAAASPSPTASPVIQAADRSQEDFKLRLRTSAHTYFIAASKIYEGIPEVEKSAEALVSAGTILGGDRRDEYKDEAAKDFVSAAQKYGQLAKLDDQADLLIRAGSFLRDVQDKQTQAKADEYYDSAIKIFREASPRQLKSEATALSKIALVYARSADVEQKRKGIAKYKESADVSRQVPDKVKEASSYQRAAAVLEVIGGEAEHREADALYQHAFDVYNNEPASQIKLLIDIARALDRLPNPQRKAEAQTYLTRALNVAAKSGGDALVAKTHYDIGVRYAADRKIALALASFEQARAKFEQLNDKLGEGLALNRSYLIANSSVTTRPKAEQFLERAFTALLQGVEKAQAENDKEKLAAGYAALGDVSDRKDQTQDALLYYERALKLYQSLPNQEVRESEVKVKISRLRNPARAKSF